MLQKLSVLVLLTLSQQSACSPLKKSNETTGSFSSRAINSRPFSTIDQDIQNHPDFENSQFVKSHWSIWDRPEDQLAVEDHHSYNTPKGNLRKQKKYSVPSASRNGTDNGFIYQPQLSFNRGQQYTGTQRQDCNSNMSITVFPVILAIVAAVSGLITVFIFWIIARKWDSPSSSSGHQYNNSGGWGNGQGRLYNNILGFSDLLKKVDFDQLTSLVSSGIETYKKSVENS